MSTNAQLTQEQRYQIYALMKAGHNQTETAEIVGVHKSTISREVRRNRGLRGYRRKQAHQLAMTRRQGKALPRLSADDWRLIDHLLREEWDNGNVDTHPNTCHFTRILGNGQRQRGHPPEHLPFHPNFGNLSHGQGSDQLNHLIEKALSRKIRLFSP